MEINIAPPSPLTKGKNMSQNWKIWKNDFMTYMRASKSFGKPNDVKAFILRNCIGEFGQDVIEQISTKDSNHLYNMDLLIQKLDKYFICNKEIRERYKFFTMQKNKKESILQYVITLKKMAETCNFQEMKDNLIRDKILAELKDDKLLQKLFEIENLDLEKLISVWIEYTKNMEKTTDDNRFNQNENNINKTWKDMPPHRGCCWRCGTRHARKSCPAWGNRCSTCNFYNHFTSRCQSRSINKHPQATPTAPPLLEFKNLYPDLNNAEVKKTWSWMEQPPIQNETLHTQEAPNTLQHAKQENETAKKKDKKRKETDSCRVA